MRGAFIVMPQYRPLLDRFVEKFELDRETGCWNWTACLSRKGYGKFQVGGKGGCIEAHRVSFEIFYGIVPHGTEVHHTCRNRRCVNPNHFDLLSHRDNCQWNERLKDVPGQPVKIYELKIQPWPEFTEEQCVAYWQQRRWMIDKRNKKITGKPARPLIDRFAEFIQLNWDTDCWEWLGALDKGGYGHICERTGSWKKSRLCAHRVSYELFVGDILGDLTIDHMCRNAKCVNPYHLRLLTRSENSDGGWVRQFKEATHCKNNHEFNEANTFVRHLKNGRKGRGCRLCRAERLRKSRHNKRVAESG